MEASTLIDPRVVEACASVVPVVAHGPLEHGTFDATENGRAVTRCRLYRNLDCTEHQATHEFLVPYQPRGRFRIPFTVWIDPDGKQLFRRDGWRRPDEFLLDIRLGLEKVQGPRMSKPEYAALVKPLDDGRAALVAQRYGEAAARFEEAARAGAPEIRRLAEEGLKEVRALGDSILAAAKAALKGGRVRQALPALDLLAREFATLDCGREALEALRRQPFPMRSLALYDVASVGGRNFYIRGDGSAVLQVVAPFKEGPIGMEERRFEFSLDGAAWDEMARLFESHPFFAITIPERAGAAGEGRPRISLDLWTGKSGSVAKWAGDRHADFDALHEWLLARAEAASRGKPVIEGKYDPEWRPDGFGR